MPANYSNDQRCNCSLILTEGDSAASLFNQIAQYYPGNFYDYHGLMPLRGKVKNTYGEEDAFNIENKEIQNIINLVGFRQNVHYNQETIKQLRYKSIIIASDYDDDGFHIKGLILNFFIQFWPELLQLQFFKQFTTPIITARDNKTNQDLEFYQEQDFKEQQLQHHFKNVKYLKGLGSIDKKTTLFKNICNNFNNYCKLIYNTPNQQQESLLILNQLFNNKSSNRKRFIIQYQPKKIDHTKQYIQINDILQQQVVQYSFKTLERAIPCFMDGLKDSQRKIIYHAATHNLSPKRNSSSNQEGIKVANFASLISSTYDYHHGETSLSGAIVQLAQDCLGTNNCPLLKAIGQFGNDWNPNEIAKDRYIYVNNSSYLNQFIRKEDELLYQYRLSDDGQQIEPQQLFPIVPLFLINGTTGIASGWSSNIPCFKLTDIISYIINYLSNQSNIQLNPYYNNYKGIIRFKTINGHQYLENIGVYQEDQNYYYIIETHLQKMSKSKLFNDLLQTDGKFKLQTQQVQRLSKENIIVISKSALRQNNINFKTIYDTYIYKLQKCENMTLIQYKYNQIIPIIYNNIYTLINSWIENRLYYYCIRKQKLLRQYIYDFIIQFNYKQVNEKQVFKDYQNQQITYERLFHLTPFSKIKQYQENIVISQNTLQLLSDQLLKDMIQQQSQDKKEYDYIMDKTIKFFVNKEFNLDNIIQKFNQLYNSNAKQIWIQELQEIKLQ